MKTLLTLLFLSTPAFAERPEWADRASWIEDGSFFVVGVSPKIDAVHRARELAMENGRTELMNSLNVTAIPGLMIQTRVTWEDKVDADHIVVYRLMFVSMADVQRILGRVK